MIQIIDFTDKLNKMLSTDSNVEKYRIFLRLDFSIDVYIVSKDEDNFGKDYFIHKLNEFENSEKNKSRVNFQVYSHCEYADDDFLQDVFASEMKVSYGSRFRLDTFFSRSHKKMNIKAPIITFYSYKGGMGRTTTLVAYASHLASLGKKVFIIDCDLEAPGYLNFFDLSEHEGLKSGEINGLVEFFSDIQFANDEKDVSLWKYIINIAQRNEKVNSDDEESLNLQNIFLMPAGNLNENPNNEEQSFSNRISYLDGLSRLNLADKSVTLHNFEILFNKIFDDVEGINPDVILIDSRTGFNDIIGTAIQYFTDVLVGFFGASEQSTPGLLTLLDTYRKSFISTGEGNSSFKLILVNSILPREDNNNMFGKFSDEVTHYLGGDLDDDQTVDIPSMFPLYRVEGYERIGIKGLEPPFLQDIKSNTNSWYNDIFESISLNSGLLADDFDGDNDNFEKTQQEVDVIETKDYSSNTSENPTDTTHTNNKIDVSKVGTWALRNRILQNLKFALANAQDFAENAEIKEKYFFYRSCMNELFEKSKFIIRGYKGTGKTYLYKALADPKADNIARNIRDRANKQLAKEGRELLDNRIDIHFVDVISIGSGNKSFEFRRLNLNAIDNPNYYFTGVWLIHTWNSILLDPLFIDIRNSSKLSNKIEDIRGFDALQRFESMINEGLSVFVEIEKDLKRINEFLEKNNTQLYVLYDQLDTKVEPNHWDKVVSPLINYWRDNWDVYSMIYPKIFVRTDLFRRITGTNTEMLERNIIKIEWTIDEIFSYFFKLVLANEPDNFWEIMKRPGRNAVGEVGKWAGIVPEYKNEFMENNNQLKILDRSHLTPLVNTFFGNRVYVKSFTKHNKIDLGYPYDYFKNTLSNADRDSISLRPFINTLDDNAVKKALAVLIPNRYVQSIISSDIYASRQVRIEAASKYFEDLARDKFSEDLLSVRDFINSDKGEAYRYKTLTEKQFYEMLNIIISNYKMTNVSTDEDLKTLLKANGIIVDKIGRGEKVWRWAPMYSYAWKLKSTKFDKNDTNSYLYDYDETDE